MNLVDVMIAKCPTPRRIAASAILGSLLMACATCFAQQNTWAERPPTAEMQQRPLAPLATTPIPKSDAAEVIKANRLVESDKPVREMIKNWRKPKKIVVGGIDNVNRLAWLQEVAPGVELVGVRTRPDMLKAIVDADAQVSGGCNKAVVRAAKELRWIQHEHTGIEECFGGRDVPEQLSSGAVVVTNNKGLHSGPIAWHAISLMAALTRGLDVFVQQRISGKMNSRDIPPDRLWVAEGRTMLVVGLGGIGTDIAKMAHALGMKVIATRNSSREGPDYVSYVGLANELHKLAEQADVVVVATPLTKETEGIYNASLFNRMKRGSMFINIARQGEVVDADLIAALKSGQIGAAALDGDPGGFREGDPLLKAPNLIVTPHTAAQAVGTREATGGEDTWVYMRENLRRYVKGDKLLSVVNPKLGY
jgi:phosphoglycerate dehydrogenase-like enzyme